MIRLPPLFTPPSTLFPYTTLFRSCDPAPSDTAGGHPARALLAEQGIEAEDLLLLRRVLTPDGRSRAYVNDQAASAALLRQLADLLIEIQGQFDQRGLLDPQTHRELIAAYGSLKDEARALRSEEHTSVLQT